MRGRYEQTVSFPASWQKGFFISNPEIVPPFENDSAYTQAIEARNKYEPVDMYPREGSLDTFRAEADAARLAGVRPDELILYNTGMSAVTDAFDVALRAALGGRSEQVIAFSKEPFKSTVDFVVEDLGKGDGVQVEEFDSGNLLDVERVISMHRPSVVFAETIGNGKRSPVLQLEGLLDVVSRHSPEATIILDNTLPLSTDCPVSEIVTPKDTVITVESGTKSYALNQEFGGIAYSQNTGLVQALRSYRTRRGSALIGASAKAFLAALPESRIDFDERNNRLFASAKTLAYYLQDAEQQGADFTVAHPALSSHPNHDLDAKSPVVFLNCDEERTNKVELVRKLHEDPEVQKYLDFRQSFGFDRSCIVRSEKAEAVRITGGAEIDSHALGKALQEAALRK